MVYDLWYMLICCDFGYYEFRGNLGKGVRERYEIVFDFWNFVCKMRFII